ncbi:hypothetical protein DPMN_044857 [Dreissena polymorpha]|uniref:IRG-type G domain-containing protein n=1 Tax=Dreissena polymorpha TaxID=45954 RepID=A0A9D4D3Q1_DREPO|nr:hypothetical protein DPMN_044857 [Dreissena polymorpha]
MYDFFILVSASRFKENDVWLAKEICSLEKKFYFVKSIIDTDVENDLRDSGGRLTQADIINNIRQNTTTELKQTDLTLPMLFLVNNKNIHEYDFKDLITQLINDIPVFKKDTLVLSMSSLAKSVLDEKQKLLRKRALPSAIKATIVNFLKGIQVYKICIAGSIFDVDIGALVLEANFYRKQFGTNDQCLKILAEKMNISVDDLVHKLDIQSKSLVQSTHSFMSLFSIWESIYKANRALLVAPVSAIPLCMFVQRKILKMCYEEALKIIDAQQPLLAAKLC